MGASEHPRPEPKDSDQTIDFVRKQELDRALERLKRLQNENERLRQRIRKLEQELEAARRREHRSTAPFSRGRRKQKPQRNGRKPGKQYGQHHRRCPPEQVDEQYRAAAPKRCDRCGGAVRVERTQPQYQEEIVRRKIVRRFEVEVGHCTCCGKRVQGRHPLQTSDALGAAEVHYGPEAVTLAAHLNKHMGLSYEKAAAVLRVGYGLEASRGGLCRAVARLGRKLQPTYERLEIEVRQSPVVWLDETSWRVAAVLQWLWVAVSPQVTVYAIQPGRGFQQAARLVGADYSGTLEHDGYSIYYRFEKAGHQSCLSHLIRRCRDLAEVLLPGAARFPLAVKALLQKALALPTQWERQQISLHGMRTAGGRIVAELDRLLDHPYRHPANRRLVRHLNYEFPYLFTFLYHPGLEGTNNRAERALRPPIVTRRGRGGNRTEAGARTQERVMSFLTTSRQQGKDSFRLSVDLLRSRQPFVLPLVPDAHPPPSG